MSFSYDVIDFKYLASKERSAKKRRLMTTPDFTAFQTHTSVFTPQAGSRPIFDNPTKKYTSTGMERKEEVPAEMKQQEQSFLGKYWMYILMAFLVLPRIFGDDSQSQGAAGGARQQ